jgi:hypothetical protein
MARPRRTAHSYREQPGRQQDSDGAWSAAIAAVASIRVQFESTYDGIEVPLQQLNRDLEDFSPDAAFPFRFSANVAGGGTIQLAGKAVRSTPADAAMTPVNAS